MSNNINEPEHSLKLQSDKVNFTFQNVVKDEVRPYQEEALSQVLAGTPTPEPTLPTPTPDLTLADTTTSIQSTPVTKGFTKRQEIMSNLHLMDENYNYTDTYTNYVNQGGAPVPEHQELINQERYEAIFKKEEDGLINHEDALLQAYGADILESMGYKVRSIGWWMSKYLSHDYSNPSENRYIMDQVLKEAQTYHESRLASEWGNTKTKDTQLASLVGQDVEYKQVKDLFDLSTLQEDLDDSSFQIALHTGAISALMRITQDSEGNYYYLHTDGEIYKLDGQQGENHGTLKTDANGNFIGIDLNNSSLLTTGRSLWTGFEGVFHNIADIGIIAVNTIDSFIPVSLLFGGDAGVWDGIDSEDFVGWVNTYDAWLHDNASWLVDNGYVDLDSHVSGQDVANFAANMIGSIAGTMLLGNFMGGARGGGLIGWGDALIKEGHTVSGHIAKGAGTILKWQTGNLGTNYGTVAHTGTDAAKKAVLNVWGRRLGSSVVANTKNFINDWRKMYVKSKLYDDGASEREIVARAFVTNLTNTLIDTFISGGMDDNQWQAITGRDTLTKLTAEEVKAARRGLQKALNKTTSDAAMKALTELEEGAVKKFFMQRSMVIALNSGMDLLGNLATGAIQQFDTLDEKTGKLNPIKIPEIKDIFSASNLARSAITTFWYSTRGQIKEWNTGLEVIGNAHEDILADFDRLIKNTKNADEKLTYAKVKADYIKALKESKSPTYEGKILDAMNKITKNLGNDKMPDVFKDNILKHSELAQKDFYDALWKNAEIMYAAQRIKHEQIIDPTKSESKLIFQKMFNLTGNLYKKLVGIEGRDRNVAREKIKNDVFEKQIQDTYDTLFINNYDILKDLQEDIDKRSKGVKTKDPLLTQTGASLKESNPKLFEKLSEKDSEAINKTYFILPNESRRLKNYHVDDKALEITTQLGYIKSVDTDNNVYEIQPCFDGQDFVNTSLIISQVYLSIQDLSLLQSDTSQEASERRTRIFNDLLQQVTERDADIKQKTELVANLLYTLSDPDEDDVRRIISTKQAASIMKELQDNKQIHKFTNKNFKNMKTTEALEFYRAYGECMALLAKGKGDQIDISDPMNRKALEAMVNQKDSTLTKKSYDKLVSVMDANQDFFDNGNPLNKKRAFVQKQLERMFSGMDSQGKYSKEEIQEQIKLYFERNNVEDKKLLNTIEELADAYDNIYKNTKTVTLQDNDTIYINLSGFQGRETNRMLKELTVQADVRNVSSIDDIILKDIADKYQTAVTKELEVARQAKLQYGNIVAFNLNTQGEELADFLDKFGYGRPTDTSADSLRKTVAIALDQASVKNYRGDLIVLDVPKGNIDAVRDALKHNRITLTVDGKTQEYNFNNKTVKDLNGYEWGSRDYYQAILDTVELENIDPKIGLTLRSLPFLNLLPYKQTGKTDFTEVLEVALLSDGIKNSRKYAGKAGGQTTQAYTAVFHQASGAEKPIDKNLETFFILDMIATRMTSEEYGHRMTLPVSKEEAAQLKEAGLVDYYVSNSNKPKRNEGTFWEISRGGTLQLKDNVSAKDLRSYITSKDFNFFKFMPLLLTDSENKHGMLTAYEEYSTKGIEDMPSGMAQENVKKLLYFDLPWDDAENTRFREFLHDIKDAYATNGLKYNPFDGKVDYEVDYTTYDSFEEWNEKTKNSKNPYDILLHRYYDDFSKMIRGKRNQAKYNNETLILKNKKAQQTLLDAIQNGEEVSEKLINKLKEDMNYKFRPDGTTTSTIDRVYTSSRVSYPVDPASKDTLIVDKSGTLVGGFSDNVEITSGYDWMDLETVTAAYNRVKDIITNTDNEYYAAYNTRYMPIDFYVDNVTRIFQLAEGGEGYIAVQDIDEWADALFENSKQLADYYSGRIEEKPQVIMNSDSKAAMEFIFKANAEKIENKIFNEAKRLWEIQNKFPKITERKGIVKYDAASTSETPLSKGVSLDNNGDVNKEQFNNFFELVHNAQYNRQLRNQDKLVKLSDAVNLAIDTGLEDLQRRTRNDRLFTTSSPMDSITSNISIENNETGMMHTVINTYQKLLDNFYFSSSKDKDKVKDNLMDTAITLVNSHVGVDYAGETMDYFVVGKDGKITDLDSLGAANYMDLLYNISNSKRNLLGSTIIKANTQGIDNTAALQMTQLKLTKDNFSDFVTELWANLVYSNQKAFQRYYKDGADKYMDELVKNMPTGAKLQEVLEHIPAQQYSTLQRNRYNYEIFVSRSSNEEPISYKDFTALTKGVNTLDLLPQASQALRKYVGQTTQLADEAYNNDLSFRQVIDLSLGISPDTLDSKALDAIDELRNKLTHNLGLNFTVEETAMQMLDDVDNYLEDSKELQDRVDELLRGYNGSQRDLIQKILTEEYLLEKKNNRAFTTQEKIKFIVAKALLDNNRSTTLDYLVRNRSLLDMKESEKSGNIENGFVIDKANNEYLFKDTKPLLELLDSLKNNTNPSQYTKLIAIDTETDLKGRHDVFSIGIYVKEFKDGEWKDSHYTVYLDKSAVNTNDATKQKIIDEWLKEYSPETHEFVTTNEGYRRERDTYKNILSLQNGEDTLFLRPEKAREFITNLFGTKDDTILLGYNSADADIEWLKKAGVLSSDIRDQVTHIDEMLLLHASQNVKAKGSLKLENIAKNLGIDAAGAHGSVQDAQTTMRIFEKVLDYSYNINSIRNYEYRYIDNILKAYFKDNYESVVHSQDFIKTLQEIDDAVKDARNTSSIGKYFNPDYKVNPSDVVASTDLFEYIVNKKLNNYVEELNRQDIRDTLLDATAKAAVENGTYKRIEKLWTFANSNGVPFQKFIESISDSVGPLNNVNALINTISSEQGLDSIMTRLGLNIEDFDEKNTEQTHLFGSSVDPNTDPRLDADIRNSYNKYGKYNNEVNAFRTIMNALHLDDPMLAEDILFDIATFQDFNENKTYEEVMEHFGEDIRTLPTRTQKLLAEYIDTKFNDIDSIVATYHKGTYDLIDALEVGTEIKDLLTNSTVTTEAQDVVIDKRDFENLVHMSLESYVKTHKEAIKENGGVFVQFTVHPGDNTRVLPMRLRVTQSKYSDRSKMQIPETVLEVVGQRDVDGDQLSLLAPEDYSQRLLSIYCNEIFRIHNVQESFLETLKQLDVPSDDYIQEQQIYNVIGKDPDIISLCLEANKALENDTWDDVKEDLTNKFISKLKEYYVDIDKDDKDIKKLRDNILSMIWVKDVTPYEETKDPTTKYAFVNNPAIYWDSEKNEPTYSNKVRLNLEGLGLLTKEYFRSIDQSTGMVQKAMSSTLTKREIKNPWTDILFPNIYGSEIVYKRFKNIKQDDTKTIDKLVESLHNSVDNIYTNVEPLSDKDKLIKKFKTISRDINSIETSLKEGDNTKAFSKYNDLLVNLDKALRTGLNKDELLNELKSDAMTQHYIELNNRVKSLERAIDLRNSLHDSNNLFPNRYKNDGEVMLTLKNELRDLTNNSSKQYNNNLYSEQKPAKVFVITRGDTSGIGEATILYNRNTSDKRRVYTERVITLGANDKLSDIVPDKTYKKGTVIAYNKYDKNDAITLDNDFTIGYVEGNKVKVYSIDKLDSQVKCATDTGAKGVINASYSIKTKGYKDIAFLYQDSNPQKSAVGNAASQFKGAGNAKMPEEIKITLVDENNNTKTVYGYIQENVGFIPVGNTKNWAKYADRKEDLLHKIGDAYTINAFMHGNATYDEDEDSLTIDPEYIQQLKDRLFKRYNYSQDNNKLPVYNKMKFAYILNNISDEELLKAFDTDMSAEELRDNLLNKNIALGTAKYSSMAQELGERFINEKWFQKDLNDPKYGKIIRALFDKNYWVRMNNLIQTATEDFDYSQTRGKNSINKQGGIGLYSIGRPIQFSKDELSSAKDFTSWETGGYLSSLDFYDMLLGNDNPFDTFSVTNMIRDKLLPVGKFKEDAVYQNGFRHANVKYVSPKLLKGGSISTGLAKTSNVATRSIPVEGRPVNIKLSVPSNNELTKQNTEYSHSFEPSFLTFCLSTEPLQRNNVMTTSNTLKSLEQLDQYKTLPQKLEGLNNNLKTYKVKDIHFALIPNDKGNVEMLVNESLDRIGTLRELKREANKSLYNYSTWQATKSDLDNKTVSNTFLEENVDKSKGKQIIAGYLRGEKQIHDALNSLQVNLKNDFFDKKTGEVYNIPNVNIYDTESDIKTSEVLDGGNESVIKESIWGRQGLDENDPFNAQLSTAMKRVSASQIASEQDLLSDFTKLLNIRDNEISRSEFKKYNTYRAIFAEYKDPSYRQLAEQHLHYFNIDSIETVVNYLNRFKLEHTDVEMAYNNLENKVLALASAVTEESGEPMTNILALTCPYKGTSKETNKQEAYAVLHKMYNQYDPSDKGNESKTKLVYDFDNSMKSIIKELSAMHAARHMANELKANNLLDNTELINTVNKVLSDTIHDILRKEKPGTRDWESDVYVKETDATREIKDQVFNYVSQLTGMSINEASWGGSITQQYKSLFDNISFRLQSMIDSFNKTNKTDIQDYTDFYLLANSTNKPYELKHQAKVIADFYYAKMICTQGMLDSSYRLQEKVQDTANNLRHEGYCFVNKYGQKYVRNGIVSPLTGTSLSHLKENMGIAYNSKDERTWNQFLMQKIMAGELYLMKEDVADYLEKHQYTRKVGSNTLNTLKKISKWSASLQMALPSKILNRVISFTGFDYSMGMLYDPEVIQYIGPARRELLAAYQSKGTQMSDELREYMEREGQPIGLTGKDPITFSEDMNATTKAGKSIEAILDKLTDPLEFQNHLGRYAIYRAALKSFEDGDPWYGPLYSKKDAIDSLRTNEDKAMYIMDYILGSPGGFPELAKKTSGVMMYATFPMNFSRTLGAWGMSMAKLFQEGYTAENSKYWMQAAFTPAVGAASITAFVMLLNSWICDLLGVDEKGKDDITHSLSTLDPIGTLIGGTPTKSGASMNPVENVNSMFIEPFTNENNDTLFKKIYGLVNTNIISHFNPAIKTPLELITGYDLFSSSPIDTKHQYTNVENAERKVIGFLVGSNIANNVITKNKIDKYAEDTNFLDTLSSGITRGIQESLGNQKTYKKDTSNYYNQIYKLNSYKYKVQDAYEPDWEDYTKVDEMEIIRNSSSKYGQYNSDDYKRISKLLRKMITNKEEPSTVYSLITKEYQNGVSEATLKAVLNNNSIVRKLEQIDADAYLRTLSSRQYAELIKAIEYENTFYPMLQEFFPKKDKLSKTYLPTYKKDYVPSSSSSTYVSRPKSYYPNSSSYYNYKKKYYNTYKNNYKFDNNVKVSPQMGIWDNNYNEVKFPKAGGN